VWSYDSDDRPSGVVRAIDGQQWLQQSWAYGEGARIESVDTTLDVELADQVYGLAELDDLAPDLWPATHTAWEAARPADNGGCLQLPRRLRLGRPPTNWESHSTWLPGTPGEKLTTTGRS
jgi:hypothetical protein